MLVNDFGDINIDADFIESRDGNVLNLAGGCVSCSVGSHLVAALLELPKRLLAFDHLLIETSGVALPGSVARTVGLFPALALDAVIVVVDVETVRERAAGRYVGDTVQTQLTQANLIVVNKLDLVDAAAAAGLRAWRQEQAPGARTIHASHGQIPASVILGVQEPQAGVELTPPATTGLFAASPRARNSRLRPVIAPAAQKFASASFELVDPALGHPEPKD